MKEMVGGCCVCSDERGWADNPLVYCDGQGCNVAVHQACYGIVSVPTGPWFCRKCESQERITRVRCELCPQKQGALKKTDMGGWCHVVCALFIPEAWFGNVQTMEPIILKGVPPERFSKPCYICEERGRQGKASSGACMQCNKSGCKQHFHVTCAQTNGLLCEEAGNYDNVKYCGYCAYHYKKLKKDSNIKTIPAFRPIGSGATPENTPQKHGPLRDKRLTLKAKEPEEGDVYDFSASPTSNSAVLPPTLAATGKFTTANFTETTITPSPANLGDFKKKEDKSDDSSSGESDERKSDSASSSPASVTTPTTEAAATVVSSAGSATTSTSGSAVTASSGASSTTTPTTTTTATSQSSSTFSYTFENFLSQNYNKTSQPTQGPASSSTESGSAPAKRRRSRSSEVEKPEKEKKRKGGKKAKTETPAAGPKAKTVKDLLAASTSPTSPQLSPTLPTTAAKKTGGKKKKNENALAQNSLSLVTPGTFSQSLANSSSALNVSLLPTKPGLFDGAGDSLVNGGTSLIGTSKSTKTPGSPKGDGHTVTMPTSMEQLLERQWEQGSQFLMEQGQHFDIASLLNCLNQLRQENNRLEDHISALTARRDQLMAVSARLSIPLTPLNPKGSSNPGSQGTSPETGSSHSRSPRVNNFIPADPPADIGSFARAANRSPGQSPAQQNHLPTTPLHTHSPGSQAGKGLPHSSPESRVGGHTATTPPSGAAPQLTEQQRHLFLQQQQHLLMSQQLSPEQQHHLMYQMLQHQQQQQQQHASGPPTSLASSHTTNPAQPQRSPIPQPPVLSKSPAKAGADKSKTKT